MANSQPFDRRRFVGHAVAGTAAILGLAAPRRALAALQFPTRPIRIIIPFAAGGNADIIMRILADKLSARLPQRVFIDNRVGGGGIVAAEAVRSSPPDGHTLFVLAVGTAISVALFKSLPFDPIKDFVPISEVSKFDMLLLVKSSSPIRTIGDFVAEAGRRGEAFNVGTTLPGSSQYLAGALLKSVAGVKTTIIPYRTSPDVLTALLRGDIALGVESYSALRAAIDSGQVRAIASSGTERSLPDVPTAHESGMPKFEVVGWNALFAPAGTSAEIIEFLNKEIREAVALPDFRKRVGELGGAPQSSSAAELAQLLTSDIAKWRAVVDQAGIERK
jgi:tripartite-type tricarboxylate transporter receptor subunit TctC